MIDHRDVVIIGAGAAGLGAGIVLAGARATVPVVDDGKPRNTPAAHVPGFGSRDGTAGSDFPAVGRSEFGGHGGEYDYGKVAATSAIGGRLRAPDVTAAAVRRECAEGVAR
ncbi:FAD-binding protein [Embleya sp. NPDC001921]